MWIRQVMTDDVATCGPEETLARAAALLWERDVGALPVVDHGGRVVGMITDRDICMAAYTTGRPLHEVGVAGAMAKVVHACHPDDRLADALRAMAARQVRRMPVVDHRGRLEGVVSINDLTRATLLLEETDVSVDEALEALLTCSRPRRRAVEVGSAP
jgi:CBS domain-containing protein